MFNAYVQFDIAGCKHFFWGYFGGWAAFFLCAQLGDQVYQPYTAILGYGCCVAAAVFVFIMYIQLTKSFGLNAGFGVGLIFLSPIFLMILGCGSSAYVGPGGVRPAGPAKGAGPSISRSMPSAPNAEIPARKKTPIKITDPPPFLIDGGAFLCYNRGEKWKTK